MDVYTELLIQGFSAFSGAFFAFLFLRLAEFFSKIYQRQVKHYNALVLLETQLNELGGVVHDNIYLIPFFRNAITSGNIYFSKLRQLPIDRSHYLTLHDIELINELFSFNYQLRKLNDDIGSLADGYADIKNAYIQHHIEKQDYLVNAQISAEHLTALEAFLGDMEDKTVQLVAKVRLMAKNDVPLGTKLARFFIHTSGIKLSKEEIDEEASKLQEEIEETKTQSQKEIEELIKKFREKQSKINMSKHRDLVQKALEQINAGFDQMDRKIENASLLDRYLIAASVKAMRLADTILFLGDHGVTDEAFPVLRSLVEHAINMRWITEEDTKQRLKMYMGDLGNAGFGNPWASKSLDKRMEDIGFGNRDYFDFCVKLTYSYAHVNASSLRWGEVFDDPSLSKNRWTPDSLYSVVAQMLGHVMKALESRYKCHFDKYNDIWQQISVDKDIRKKVEAVRKEFEKSD